MAERVATETAGCLGGCGGRGAPARRRMPSRRARIPAATAGSSFCSVSRTTQARWPSDSRAARSASARAEPGDGVAIDERQAAEGPRQGLLDVGLGVADELADEFQAMPRDVGLAPAAMIDERHGRDRATDEPTLPARRRVDELVELRPAVRLGEDALADGMCERIDRDPVARFAGGAAQQLPGALRIVGDEALEEPEGEPAWLELRLAQQAIGDEQPAAGAVAPGRIRGSPA